ncbi:helix-turn-helix transcriptional regulator [Priestia megaterium]|uniref:Helix-turn-helix transcriptional regulator n=1 Tax=Priestia megaterium TaxID=1404 RepID=A0A6H1PBM8_PRIMG|nr:helix-turn-helix transcriptional regulator [Priestia megaterium]
MPIKDLAVCNQIIAKEVKVYDSEKFRLIRLYSGMSQRDFAEYIGVSTATIAHIETGNRTVTPMVKSRLAEKFDLTDDFLKYVDRYRRLSQ